MELAAEQWKALGVTTKLKAATDTAYGQALFGTGAWDVVVLGIGAINPGVLQPFFTGPTPPNGQNIAAVKNDTFTSGVGKATTTPGDEGCKSWFEAERALVSASDVAPFAGLTTAFYGNKATFTIDGVGTPTPTSYRVLK
jgi:peptide/nickel transport system substrate-binding protein